jgi:hypothetical protein
MDGYVAFLLDGPFNNAQDGWFSDWFIGLLF